MGIYGVSLLRQAAVNREENVVSHRDGTGLEERRFSGPSGRSTPLCGSHDSGSCAGSRLEGIRPARASCDLREQRILSFLKGLDRHFPSDAGKLREEVIQGVTPFR